MSKTRKKYSAQFKFDRSLEAIKSDNLSEISRKYRISVNILSKWRSELLEKGPQTFANSPDKEKKQLKTKITKLEQMLGKKEVELYVLYSRDSSSRKVYPFVERGSLRKTKYN